MRKRSTRLLTIAATVFLLSLTATGCSSDVDPDVALEGNVNEEATLFEGDGLVSVNELMNTVSAADGKESPDNGAATVAAIDQGTMVFVIGEAADGWYEITHAGQRMYIEKSALQAQEAEAELLQEVAQMEEENAMIIEAVERARSAARQSRIWGVIIILLIAGIFAVGIIATVKNNRINKEAATPDDAPETDSLEWIDLEQGEDKPGKEAPPK